MSIRSNSNGRVWIGSILIIVGALIFLKNFHFNILNINIFSWPVILLVIGGIILVNHKDSFLGLGLVIIGGIGIFSNYFHISFRYILSEYWPFILIILGLYLIFRQTFSKETDDREFIESTDYFLDLFSIFSEKTKKIKTDNFLGGKTTSMFGELIVDLTDCKITSGTIAIDTLTLFGATEILIPADWQVIIKTTTVFGGFEDKRSRTYPTEDTNEQVVIIKGLVLFGGGEIKS